MLRIATFSQRGRYLIPAPPVAVLVARDQQDHLPCRIEGEQDPYLGVAAAGRAQLFQVVVPAPLDPVDERPALVRTTTVDDVADRLPDERGCFTVSLPDLV